MSNDIDLITHVEHKTKKPAMFQVFILNDDFTPMDFVVEVICHVFGKSLEEATHITWKIHKKGRGLCGVYTCDIAETKAMNVIGLAQHHGHPLLATVEPL